jgi:UDP-glucose 4-epimerase
LPINGDGSNSRDFTFVATVCDVLLAAVSRQVTHPEPVNLAFGTNTTLTELVKLIGEVSGVVPDVEYRSPRPGDVPHSQADNGVLRSLFPEVVPTDLLDGLSQTLAWMRDQ